MVLKSNDNPLARRIKLGIETDGMQVFKYLTPMEWLKQPTGNLTPFHHGKEHYRNPANFATDSYDKNAAYLAAMHNTVFGVGEYHRVVPDFDSRLLPAKLLPGIWNIIISDYPSWNYPLDIVPMGESWQYTPVIEYLREKGVQFYIKETYVFETGKTVLERFYQYARTMRQLDPKAAKEMYTRFFGMLNHPLPVMYPGAIYRPDWHGTIVAQSKVTIHRQALKAYTEESVKPVGWVVDCLYYGCEVKYFNERLGNGIGQYKHEKI